MKSTEQQGNKGNGVPSGYIKKNALFFIPYKASPMFTLHVCFQTNVKLMPDLLSYPVPFPLNRCEAHILYFVNNAIEIILAFKILHSTTHPGHCVYENNRTISIPEYFMSVLRKETKNRNKKLCVLVKVECSPGS